MTDDGMETEAVGSVLTCEEIEMLGGVEGGCEDEPRAPADAAWALMEAAERVERGGKHDRCPIVPAAFIVSAVGKDGVEVRVPVAGKVACTVIELTRGSRPIAAHVAGIDPSSL